MGYRSAAAAGFLIATCLLVGPVARADVAPPDVGASCATELNGVMTLLTDGTTYVRCEPQPGGYAWVPAVTPFPPNDSWLSYGPPITLHGQAMRNPNLSSGAWTATPRDPETTCRVTQTTVVEAGVLAAPQVSEAGQGQPLEVEMQPKLFYAELAGNCVWVKD